MYQPWGTNLVQRCQNMGEGEKEGGESGKRSPEDFDGESGNDHSGLKGRSSQSLLLRFGFIRVEKGENAIEMFEERAEERGLWGYLRRYPINSLILPLK